MNIKYISPVKRKANDFAYYEALYNSLEVYCNKNNILIEKEIDDIDRGLIYVNNIPIACYVISDFDIIPNHDLERIAKYNPKVIFKNVYSKTQKYDNRVISGGYFSPIFIYTPYTYIYKNIDNREIDIISRMRVSTDKYKNRELITAICKSFEIEFNVKYGKLNKEELYFKELENVRIGYNWKGYSKLNFRIIEYLAFGIPFISDNLSNNPLREDIELKHEENCIFVETAKEFKKETILLLKDKDKMNKIGKNNYDLYNEKLTPYKMGEWYITKLKQYEHTN